MPDSVHPIRAYRKSQHPPIPLETLAGDVGVTKATLSRIETGALALSDKLALRLARRTGISMQVLRPDLFEAEAAQ